MENIVEGVEDEREKEGSPADAQCCEDSEGCEVMRVSFGVNHIDGPSCCSSPYQGHHCQTERTIDKLRITFIENT